MWRTRVPVSARVTEPASLVIDSCDCAAFPYNWLLRQLYESSVRRYRGPMLVSYRARAPLRLNGKNIGYKRH